MSMGGRHVAGVESDEAQESCPWAKPALKVWFAAAVASTALFETPGAIKVPPTVPSTPPWNVFEYGGLDPTRSTTLPGSRSLNSPKPDRSTVFEAICQASAVRG